MAYNNSSVIAGNMFTDLDSLDGSETSSTSLPKYGDGSFCEDVVHFHHYEGVSQGSFAHRAQYGGTDHRELSETEDTYPLPSSPTSISSGVSIGSEDNVYQCMSSGVSIGSEDNVYQCMTSLWANATLGATSKNFHDDDGYFSNRKSSPLNDLQYYLSDMGNSYPDVGTPDLKSTKDERDIYQSMSSLIAGNTPGDTSKNLYDTENEENTYQSMASLSVGDTPGATSKDFYDDDNSSSHQNCHFKTLRCYLSEIEDAYPASPPKSALSNTGDKYDMYQRSSTFHGTYLGDGNKRSFSKNSEEFGSQEVFYNTLDNHRRPLLKTSSPIEIPNSNKLSKIVTECENTICNHDCCEPEFLKTEKSVKNNTPNTQPIDSIEKYSHVSKSIKFIKSISSSLKRSSTRIRTSSISSFTSLSPSTSYDSASDIELSNYSGSLAETDLHSRTMRKNKLLSKGITEFILDTRIRKFSCFSKSTLSPDISKNLSILEERVRALFPDCDKNILDEIVALNRFILRKGLEESEKFLKKCRKKYMDKFDKDKFLTHSINNKNELEMSQKILDALFTETDMMYISCYAKAFVSVSYNKYRNVIYLLLNTMMSNCCHVFHHHMGHQLTDDETYKSKHTSIVADLERKLNQNLISEMDVVFNVVLGYKYRKDESFKKVVMNRFEMNLAYI
ncbi:hypothetical protein [Candidatus Ichthyocystis hellenicum]|uniref:hypothetical protein n=1 Tax=Candidatus Ichthyocystis hellenicum TaxID=1561003 RepID=UPI000B8410EB|nr:hypothetical protein [Candidatus Ichthyocystis hellenicum]